MTTRPHEHPGFAGGDGAPTRPQAYHAGVATFMRRPAPELRIVPLERNAILAATNGVALAA